MISFLRARRWLQGGGLAVAILLAAAVPGWAQSVSELSNQIRQLQMQVQALQAGTGGAAGPVAANQQVRMQQLEDQLRGLTGQVEQLGYRLQQVSTQLDKLVSDVDFRLAQLERGGAAPMAADGTAPADSGTPPPPPSDQGTAGSGAASQQQALATGPGTLGTIGVDPQTGEALPAALEPTSDTPEAQYQAAFGLLRAAKYPDAEAAFKRFLQRYPEGPLAGNAQYWIGETFYVRGEYQQAAVAFAEGYQRYPNSSKAADNLLKLSMSLSELGRKQDACAALDQLRSQFPTLPPALTQKVQNERQRSQCL